MRTKPYIALALALVLCTAASADPRSDECTTAVVSAAASERGAPILWKNRDTEFASNKVVFVDESPYDYLALVNAHETSGRWAYAGLNAAGFGIYNAVASNLPKKSGEMVDLEGAIMADALRTCATVSDFQRYLEANTGPSLGSWANFGVLDAKGGAAIFEAHNNGFKRRDAARARAKYIVSTNFSTSGDKGKGHGYLRFERATELFKRAPSGGISHRYILTTLARDIGHPLLDHPSLPDLRERSGSRPLWIHAHDTIDRATSASTVVIAGRKPGDDESIATLWVILGEPLTSIAVPLWVEAGEVPNALHKGKDAPIARQAMRIKRILRPFAEGNKRHYLDVSKLANEEGTGILRKLAETEVEILEATASFLEERRSPGELASFQEKMARKALAALKRIR
jgi:hypothetical protein